MNTVSVFPIALALLTTCAAAQAGKPIPQPVVLQNLKVAPDSLRVDLMLPSFSNPTQISNPLFPVSRQESVLFSGQVDGKPFRTEVTLLPYTRVINWNDVQVETLVSQYTAFLDGRIEEVAIDLYAQADDGSVWYFGEDMSGFRNGVIYTKEGTWQAGQDGPPAMIMPGNPKVGDTYRTENMPGIAFEEVSVKELGKPLDGPFGPVNGGMIGKELHFDGNSEDKQFGPGYGEFHTAHGPDFEALAMAVPADRASGPMPSELALVTDGAMKIFDSAMGKDWKSASVALKSVEEAWGKFPASEVPRLVQPRVRAALEALGEAVDQRNVARACRAAIETARWSNDAQLRYKPAAAIDKARLGFWAAELQADAAAGDEGAVNGDTFSMIYTKDRIIHGLSPENAQKLNLLFGELQPAAGDGELKEAAKIAGEVRAMMASLK